MADKKISQLTGATTPLAGTEVLPVVQGGSTVKVSVADLTAGRAVAASEITTTGNVLAGATSNFANCRMLAENGTGQQLGARYTGVATHYLSVVSNGDAVFNRDGTEWARLVNATLDYKVTSGNFVVGTAGKGIDFSANANAPGMTSELLTWYEEGNWTPTVTATTGAITTLGAVSGKYTRIGRRVFVNFSAAITTNGTGAGSVRFSGLPFAINGFGSGSGRENGVNGFMIQSAGFNGNTYFDVLTYLGLYPGGSGYLLEGFIEYNV